MIKKITFTAVIIMLFAASSVFAQIDSCEIDSETDKVTIKGTVKPNEQILLTVVEKGASEDDFFNKMAYQYQKTSGDDGSFTFEFKMGDAALYTVYASTPDTTYTYDFVFTNKNSAKTVIERINAAKSVSEIENIIRNDRYAAGLFIAECDAEPDYSYIAGIMANSRPYPVSNIDEVLDLFKQYLVYGYIRNGSIDNIFELDKYINIYDIPGTEIFTENIFKESHQLETTKRLIGKTISDRNEFEDSITEQMALALIMDPDGYGNIEKVCKTFADRIGIDTSNVNTSVYRNLYGQSFSSFSELGKKFNELKNLAGTSTGNSGGAGGGGGGGGAIRPNNGISDNNSGIVTSVPDHLPEKLPLDTEKESVFSDLAGYDWAKEAIEALYSKGIISGRTDDTYAPGDDITRSEFVKLVVLAFNVPDSDGRVPFIDTSEGEWDYEYICDAYNAGIINGISTTEFGCKMPISRQDMAVIIQRAANIADVDTDLAEKFADDWRISNYAYNAAYALKDKGIMIGDDNGMFNPKNTATRAEAAKVIYESVK